MDNDDREWTRALPGIEGETFARVADQIDVVVLAASIDGKASVSLSLLVTGGFERPGARAELQRTVVVVSAPATVLPR